jgi:hypothetical protein
MKTIEQIKSEYRIQMEQLLLDYPEELRAFEELWTSGKLREAYVLVTQITKKLGLVRSQKNKEADEAFFATHIY